MVRALSLLFITVTTTAFGTTLVSITDPSEGYSTVLSNEEIIGTSWSQTAISYGTEISVPVFSVYGYDAVGTAYLMYAPGPGTTPEPYSPSTEQLAIAPFIAPQHSDSDRPIPLVSMFTNLSLSPGTYYLILSVPDQEMFCCGPANWILGVQGGGLMVTTTSGFSAGPDFFALCPCAQYPPASNFIESDQMYYRPLFTVNGSLTPVPEPSSIFLCMACLGILAFARQISFKLQQTSVCRGFPGRIARSS